MTTVVSTSAEPILLGPISHKVVGVETDPTGLVVEAGFTDSIDVKPTAWTAATWETHTDGAGRVSWWVRISVGPTTTIGALDIQHHQCWARVTVSGTEKPVLPCGTLTVI